MGVLVAAAVLGFFVGRLLITDAAELSAHAPRIVHQLAEQVIGKGSRELLGQPFSADELTQDLLGDAKEMITSPGGVAHIVTACVELIPGVVLTFILMIYFYVSGSRVTHGLLWLVPPARRDQVRSLAVQASPMLNSYIRSLGIVITYATVLAWICIGPILKMPYAVLLGVITGLLELIPIVGPIASAAIVGSIALEQGSLKTALGVALFFVVLRLSIDQMIAPLVMGRAVTLHPVTIMFAFLAGGLIYGILGVLVAIPVAATIKIVLANLYGESAGQPP
jgi:predicted PurR-regulated permease PerM